MSLQLSQFLFGAPDAESEVTIDGGDYLKKVFFDPFNCIKQIESGKFVLSARKGMGKSEFIYHLHATKSPDKFVTVLKYKKFETEKILLEIGETPQDATQDLLWKFIILCTLLDQIRNDNSISWNESSTRSLDTALKRTKAFTSLDGYQVKEIIKKNGSQLGTAPFKDLATFAKSKSFETRETQVPILKLIPLFEALIVDIFSLKRDAQNSFFVCIDDLDEAYRGTTSERLNIISLMRVAKELHTSFHQHGIRFYPVISIRSDILETLCVQEANLHKIYSANTLALNWYSHATFRDDPNFVPLKQIVNERILLSYQRLNLSPPRELFNSVFAGHFSSDPTKDNFKYVLDGTLYRPRDLIIIIKLLQEQFPRKTEIYRDEYNRVYKRDYAQAKIREWQGELLAYFPEAQIHRILEATKKIIQQKEHFRVADFEAEIRNQKIENDALEILSILYGCGMIANTKEENSKRLYNWIYRSENLESAKFFDEHEITFHTVLKEKYKKVAFWS